MARGLRAARASEEFSKFALRANFAKNLGVKLEKEGNFMVVKCDIVLCAYNKGGFCKRKAVVHINGNGVCNVLTKPNWQEGDKK